MCYLPLFARPSPCGRAFPFIRQGPHGSCRGSKIGGDILSRVSGGVLCRSSRCSHSGCSSVGGSPSAHGVMTTAGFLPCNSMWLHSSGRLLLVLLLLIFFLVSSRVACAEDLVGTAYDKLYGDSLTSRREYGQMLEDLASRWWDSEGNVEGKTCPIVDINGNPIGSNFQDRLQFRTTMLTLGSGQYCIVDRETGEPIRMGSPAVGTVYDDWYEYFTGESADLGGGGSGSGGSGGSGAITDGVLPSSITLDALFGRYRAYSNSSVVDERYPPITGTTKTINYSDVTNINSYLSTNGLNYVTLVLESVSNQQDIGILYLFASASPISVGYVDTGSGPDYRYPDVHFFTITATSSSDIYYNNYTYYIDGDTISASLNPPQNNAGTTKTITQALGCWTNGASGSAPEPTPTDPIHPPQVDLPTPDAPTVNVSPDVTFSPTVNVSPTSNGTSTTTVDLTPILEAIRILNDNLIAYGDALESDINGGFEFLSDFLGDWFDFFSGQMDGFSTLFDEWMRYLDVDLQAVITWLRAIYETMGDDINNVIADPVVQPDSWWDRLGGLLDGLLGDLPTALGDMTSAFSGIRTLFPFSIPWDLGVLLGLFVAQPVTPVFNIPYPYSVNGVAYVRVDCSPYDGVMAAVRSVELVIFAAGLAFKTRDMLRNVEV